MDDLATRARELLARWEARTHAVLAGHPDLFDAHVHLGTDIGGMVGELDVLLEYMDRYRVSGANVFCLNEPDRHPGFRAANDRTLEFARRAPGRIVPYVRLDLDEEPIDEAERCLDLGARGIKLHLRAQRIALADPRLNAVFALAAERQVPILIHAGLGLPPIGSALTELLIRHDRVQLIVAHAGIADMGGLTQQLAGRAGVFFDTSTWSAIDLADLLRRVAPEQILYASDFPYGQQPGSLWVLLAAVRAAGIEGPALSGILGENARRLVRGEPPLEPSATPPGGDLVALPISLARIHQYVTMAMPLLWTRQPDALGVVGLALNICDGPDDEDSASRAEIRELLGLASELWATAADAGADSPERARTLRLAFRLLHLADIVSVTGGGGGSPASVTAAAAVG